jgi:DUF4097 and DUF4098 domain-containing protein YvlB
MTRRSLVAPLILIVLGVLFLANSLNPEIPLFRLIALYWPFLLIAWGALRLLEILALAAMNKPFPKGIGGGEIALIVLICFAGTGMYSFHRHFESRVRISGPWGPRTLEIFGEEHEYPVQAQRETKELKRLIVEHGRGNIRITGGDAADVRVTGRKNIRAFDKEAADRMDQRTPLEILVEADRATVRTHQERITGNVRISTDLEIAVPRGVAVEARGQNGDIDIIQVAGPVLIESDNAGVRLEKVGGDARVETRRSGLIRAIDLKGNLELESGGNDIELENIAGEVRIRGSYGGTLQFQNLAKPLVYESRQTELRFAALPGRITMDLSQLNGSRVVGPFRLVTKSRDVQLEDVSNAVNIDTERGDIEIRTLRTPVARIEARSKTGNIEVALPAKATFQLDATTERGEARNDFGPPIQITQDGLAAAMKGAVGDGPLVKLSTERGSVSIRKSEGQLQETRL